MQNVTRTLYNAYKTCLQYISASPELIPVRVLHEFTWRPFFTAADTLLHMLVQFCRASETPSASNTSKV